MLSKFKSTFVKRRSAPSTSTLSDGTAAGNQALVTTPSLSYSGRTTTAINVARCALSIGEAVGEAIPVAGGPLKAAASGIHKILDLFDIKDKNKQQTNRLARKLQNLDECIEEAIARGSVGGMNLRIERLTSQLECVHEKLNAIRSYMNGPVMPIINGSSIEDVLNECEVNIDDFVASYNFSATMNIESQVESLSTIFSEFEPGMLLRFTQSNLRNASIRSPIKATITFIDARGQETEVPLSCCISYQRFQTYLAMLFDIGSNDPIRGATYVESKQYVLTFNRTEILPDTHETWSNMLDSRGPLEMSILYQPSNIWSFTPERCPRCRVRLRRNSTRTLCCWMCNLDCEPHRKDCGIKYIRDGDFDFFSKFRVLQSRRPGHPTPAEMLHLWNTIPTMATVGNPFITSPYTTTMTLFIAK